MSRITRETKQRQKDATAIARKVPSGTGLAHRIAQTRVNRMFVEEIEKEIAKRAKEFVQ